ncbi:MAG: tetratricopeptide repeat protein [Phormidesmis sp.]
MTGIGLATLALLSCQQSALANKDLTLIQQGITAQNAGNYSAAEAAYRTAIQQEPQNATIYYNLGNALSAQGKVEAAIAAYQTTLQLDPQNADAYYNLGYWLNIQGQTVDAIAAYRQAIKFQPFDADTHYNLGVLLKAQGQLNEAETLLRHALLLNATNAGAYASGSFAMVIGISPTKTIVYE